MKIRTVYSDDTLRIGFAGSVVIAICGDLPLSSFEVLDRHYAMLLEEHSKISVLSVIRAGSSTRIRNDTKAAAVALVTKYQHQLRAQVTIVASQGLVGAVVRTFMVGFNLMTRASYPTKVFGTVEEGVRWLKSVPGQDVELADSSEATSRDELADFMNGEGSRQHSLVAV